MRRAQDRAQTLLQFGKFLGPKIKDEMVNNYFGAEFYAMVYHDFYENNIASGTMVVLEIPAS